MACLGKTSAKKKTFKFGHCANYPAPNLGNFIVFFRCGDHLQDFYLSKKTVQKNSGKGKPPPNSGNAQIETFLLFWLLPLTNKKCDFGVQILKTLHYGIRAMGAMSLRISELCLSFSPHPNISDGNFNLVHHFIGVQIFQIYKKGPVEAGREEEELESKSEVINQIFGRLQHPKNEVRYLENIFSDFICVFFHIRGCLLQKLWKQISLHL